MKKLSISLFILTAVLSLAFIVQIDQLNTEQTANPIPILTLDYGTTCIYLSDFVSDCFSIDSVTADNKICILNPDKKSFDFIPLKSTKKIIELKIWKKNQAISVLMKKSPKFVYNYQFNPKGVNYKKVELSGEFNGWTASKTGLKLINGIWNTELVLNPGEYQYLLVLYGKNQLDPANHIKVSNNMGGFNSVLVAGIKNKNETPQLSTKSFSEKQIQIYSKNTIDEIFVLWQNYRLKKTEYSMNNGILTLNIPTIANEFEKSYLRVFAYNKISISNDILIPLFRGKVLNSSNQLDRNDQYTNILYNIFVDRFYNGDKSNDRQVKDSLILPRANYLGGDIKGVDQKINSNYFNDLGVNTLWLSPVVKNPEEAFGEWKKPYSKFSAYHGYWPISFTEIDNRFGNSSLFKEMIMNAHSHQLNTLLDFVAHHVHKDHPVYKAHPDWTTSLYLPDGTLNTEKWDEYRLTTWFDVFLPTLNLAKKEVAEMLSDSALWWIKEYNLDGFRHDATKHVPLNFWRTLTNKLKNEVELKENRAVYQVGETYGSVELIASYLGSGMLDGQFDFNVYDAALGAFARGDDFKNLQYRLNESLDNYGSHNKMCYITGNQDRGRFISYAGGSLKFDENAKEAGWTRNIEVGDTLAYRKLEMLMAFNMSIPGLPVIYYGDEFGMPGGNDPDSRRMMRFGNQLNTMEQRTLQTTQRLTRLRRSNMAFIYGDFEWLENTAHLMVFTRKYFNNTAIVLFNNSNKSITYKITNKNLNLSKQLYANFGNSIKYSDTYIEIVLAPTSFDILTEK
ncbi:MAG: alpha-amylase family glycosyl hydrolase [Bacteroidales bacterium]